MKVPIIVLAVIAWKTAGGVEIPLNAEELKAGIESNLFDVLLDVRSEFEFKNDGHIQGAHLADSLASFGSSFQVATPNDLAGCETCDIAVYCRSGNRAGRAIQILEQNGFTGKLYNGQGINQWANAGYPLVKEGSVEPVCLGSGECRRKDFFSAAPSETPSSVSVPIIPPKKSLPNDLAKDDASKLFSSEFDMGRGGLDRTRLRMRGRRM